MGKPRKKTLRRGGQPNFGPFDPKNHRYDSKKDIETDVQRQQFELAKLREKYDEKLREVEDELKAAETERREAVERNAKDQDRNFQISQQNKLIADKKASDAADAVGHILSSGLGSVFSGLSFGLKGIGNIADKGSSKVGNVLSSLGSGANNLSGKIGAVIKFLTGLVTGLLSRISQDILKEFFKNAFIVIFSLLFFVGIVLLIIYGFSIPAKKKTGEGETAQESILDVNGEINVNINGLGDLYKNMNFGMSTDTSIATPRRLYFDKPVYEDGDNSTMFGRFWTATKTNPTVQKIVKGTQASMQSTRRSILKLTGNDASAPFVKRTELTEGRCDNIVKVKADLFSDKEMLQKKNMPSTNVGINMLIPKSIEWSLPMETFFDKDISKLPDSVIKMNKDGSSLEDKKKIIIPYIKENDKYVLSCGKAYFSKSQEPANILIDDVDKNTCSINLDSKPKFFNKNAIRSTTASDLSEYSL